MTPESLPFLGAVIVLVLHGLYAGSLRHRLHFGLDALPQEVRDVLGWPPMPGGLDASAQYSRRKTAGARLAHWPLPRTPRIPAGIYAQERVYRRHSTIELGLMALAVVTFAFVGTGAWMISLALLVGFTAFGAFQKRQLGPWPMP